MSCHTATLTSNKWIVRRQRRNRPRIRLICFPFAGGGASAFHSWSEQLTPDIEVCAVQLPGRETRIAEPLLTSVEEFVEAAGDAIRPFCDMPVAFFGHSMGALLSYAYGKRISHDGVLQHLIVSARRAPHLPESRPSIHALPDDEMLTALQDLRGTPPEILAHRELMDLLLPVLRADFGICETYQPSRPQPLVCPITAIGGQDDDIPVDHLEGWRNHTTGGFGLRMFDGGHFYLSSQRDGLLSFVQQLLLV